MTCMIDILNLPYVAPRCSYDPIIIKSDKIIIIRIKHVHVELHRGNQIFKPIIL